MKAYRVVTDAPEGMAIGFNPADHWPSNDHPEVDEYELLADDGGDNVFIIDDVPQKVVVSPNTQFTQYGRGPGGVVRSGTLYPEPDLLVWRTPAEFEHWVKDTYGE